MVEVHTGTEGRVGASSCADSLGASELELVNKVFVRGLCETAALISIKIDIIDPDRAVLHVKDGDITGDNVCIEG
jgi:hypothetical protein